MSTEDQNIQNEEAEDGSEMTTEEMAEELSELLLAARIQSEEIEAFHNEVKKSSETVENYESSIEAMVSNAETSTEYFAEMKLTTTQDSKAITTTRQEAKTSNETVGDLAAIADQLENKISEGMKSLQELEDKNSELTGKIESLLPGATSTGLAKSFMDRKTDYGKPKIWWTIGALAPMAALAAVGLLGDSGLLELSKAEAFSWESILDGILLRLPVTGPLIWFAVYAGRHHYLTSRLEEDYAYKEAVSRAFEGYKREMAEVEEDSSEALTILCSNVLNTIAQSPGRLYDKKHKDFTPLNVALESLDESTIGALATAAGVTPDSAQMLLRALPKFVGKTGV